MSIRHISSALALCLFSVSLRAQATVPGWTYTMNITFDSGTGPANRGSMAMRYRTTASALRWEIVQVGGTANRITNGVSVEGMYTVIRDADSTAVTVMPVQHAAMIMPSPRGLLQGQPLPTVNDNSTVQSMEDLGNGGVIMGHPTHHYRYTTTGTMTFTTSGNSCTRSTDGVTEIWVAPGLDIVPAMQSTIAHYGFARPESTGRRSTVEPVKGLPLRTKTRASAVLPNGETRVIEMTMEYTELSNAPLDASLFEVPADYQVMDMRKMMPAMSDTAAAVANARATANAGLCPK